MSAETPPTQSKEAPILKRIEGTACISNESFEKQFVMQSIEIDEHKIEFARIEPEEKISDEYVVFVGGYALGIESYRTEIRDLANSGRQILYVNPYKGIAPPESADSNLKQFKLPKTIQNKATEIDILLDHFGIKRADFVGHSQGSAVGTTVAALRPGIADNLVLVNPAGMHGDDNIFKLAKRSDAERKNLIKSLKDGASRGELAEKERIRLSERFASSEGASDKHDLRKMPWRYTAEVPGIANVNIVPLLKHLKESARTSPEDKTTSITLLTAYEDVTFPHQRIEQNIGLPTVSDNVSDKERMSAYEKVFEDTIDSYAMYARRGAAHQAPVLELPGLLRHVVNNKYERKRA